MTTYVQAGLETAPPPADVPEPTKVLVPRAALLAHAATLWANGERWKANAIRTGCIGAGDLVPVSRALAERWGLTED